MSNISFASPYLLLVIIPLLLLCLIPFFIAVRKENVTKRNVTSLILHIITSILITLVISRFTYELVITETNVYVLADVSYSSHNNLDLIDDYIDDLEDGCPKNSKIGVVAFAKDYELLNAPGEDIKSVKEANLDNSATNIADALKYTGSLFKDNVIKRIVIISDGKETNRSNIVSVVEQLEAEDIYIDAIYLDNNLKKDTKEIQISQIEYNPSTFKNKEESLDVLIEANYDDARGVLAIYNGDKRVDSKAIKLSKGLNVIKMSLDTKTSGTMDYKVKLEGFSNGSDTNNYNNAFLFTQKISNEARVLFVSDVKDDIAADKMYGESSENEVSYLVDEVIQDKEVPFTVEDLCLYDEIVLSNVDVRKIRHNSQFIKNVNTVVSEYGKRLITIGNTYIQQEDDETLKEYSKMLPTDYGNKSHEQRILAIVLDISKSLQYEDRFNIAVEAATSAIDLLEKDDYVMLIGFHGDAEILEPITDLNSKEKIKERIKSIRLQQGTSMGAGLEAAFNALSSLDFNDKQVMLISDGLPYSTEAEKAVEYSAKLRLDNVLVHTINTNQRNGEHLMKEIAGAGGGYAYYAKSVEDARSLVLGEVADNYQETVIEGGSYPVTIKDKDSMVNLSNIENVRGFYYNNPKNHADVLMTTRYRSNLGVDKEVPLYTSWDYGNGQVMSLSTSLSSYWSSLWSTGTKGESFVRNIKNTIIPDHKQEAPIVFNVEFDGSKVNLLVSTPKFNINDTLMIKVVTPKGEILEMPLAFNSEEYYTSFNGDMPGKYLITLNYKNGEIEYNTEHIFNLSYSPEYDSFEIYEASSLYHMVSENGQVSEDGKLKLTNDPDRMESYLYDFTIIFIALIAVAFIADIIIRKLTWDDVKSFFRIKSKREGKKNA